MNFKQKPTAKTTVRAVQGLAPSVYIDGNALTKMFIYVDECSDEIGWLGTATQIDGQNAYYINDVFLFDQEVHGTTTEITPEGLSSFAEEVLQYENGMDIWNNLRMWGHSHVNMGVFASGQDDKQMDEFAKIGHDWFIRLICNKKGEMTIDFFDYTRGVAFLDVQWYEVANQQEQEFLNQINDLQAKLDALRTTRVSSVKEPIVAEMKEKVKKKSYIGTGQQNYANAYGYWQDGKWHRYEQPLTTKDEKKTTTTTTIGNSSNGVGGERTEQDEFASDSEVEHYFTSVELVELAQHTRIYDLEEELEFWGFDKYFLSSNDIDRIYRVARKVKQQLGGV